MNSEVPLSETEFSQENSEDKLSNPEKGELTEETSDVDSLEKQTQSLSNDEKPTDDTSSVNQSSQIPDNEARLQQLETEHETLKSQYMRIAADFDNFRKRQTRDNDDLRIQLTCSTLSEILPVVDNFERARQQLTPEGEEAQALHRSYQGLYKQLVDVLKQLGVAPMKVVGQPFDPTLHEAVLREPSEKDSEDIVIEELQRGYHLNGRVLRHALVKVSMGPGPSVQNNSSSIDEASNDSEKINEEDSTSKET